jgi:hypothetical protein
MAKGKWVHIFDKTAREHSARLQWLPRVGELLVLHRATEDLHFQVERVIHHFTEGDGDYRAEILVDRLAPPAPSGPSYDHVISDEVQPMYPGGTILPGGDTTN